MSQPCTALRSQAVPAATPDMSFKSLRWAKSRAQSSSIPREEVAGGASMSLVPAGSWRTYHIPHLTDMHLYLSIPLDPAPPLPFLEPLVIWLFPGAPQTLPLCLSLDQLLLCSGLQKKEGQVSPCPTTILAVPAAGWTLCLEPKPMWATAGKELGPIRASDKSLKFKRRGGHCSVFWW